MYEREQPKIYISNSEDEQKKWNDCYTHIRTFICQTKRTLLLISEKKTFG